MTVIGQRVPRSDGLAKARGESIYGADYAEPGMIWGALRRSPVSAGRIARLDTARAAAMPGVRAVVTAADAPDVYGGWVLCDQRLFASDVVRYEGEPIAAVAADTLEQARAGAAALDIGIEPMPAVVDIIEAVAPGAPLVHPRLGELPAQAGTGLPQAGQHCRRMRIRPARC